MGYKNSPGVEVKELSLQASLVAASTTNGGFAGRFSWGPVDTRVLVSEEAELVKRFGKPDANTFVPFFTAADFLAYGNSLRIVRCANTGTKNATSNGAAALLIKNETVYEESYLNGQGSFGYWAAKYAGQLGNSIKVSQCGSSNAYSRNLATVSVTANAATVGDTTVNTTGAANTYIVSGDYVKVGSNPYIQVSSVNATAFVLSSALTANVSGGGIILRKWEYADQFDSAPNTSSYVANLLGSKDELHVIVVDKTGLITGIPGTVFCSGLLSPPPSRYGARSVIRP